MHAWVRRALCAVGITGGIVLLGIGLAEAASADGNSGPVTTGQNGIVSGNQTGIDAQAPINLSGNQVTVIGQDNHAGSTGGATTASSGGGSSSGSPTTSGQSGIGSGNQTAVGAQAPVNASGNQVTVIGQDNHAGSTGGATTASSGGGSSSGSPTTSGQGGIGSGNQTAVGAQAPVNASGNQVTVIGQHNAAQSLTASSTGGGGGGSAAPTTTGEGGLIAGNQTAAGLALPINLSGNQVTVIGQDNTLGSLGGVLTGGGTGGTTSGSSGGATTSGQDGIVSGNQTGIAIGIPINASGNQVTVIGQDNTVSALGGSTTGGSGSGSSTSGPTTSGQDGIGSGNQTGLTVLAPVAATGNQVTAVGQDNTVTSTGGASTGGGSTGTGETTTGQGGVGSGNQTPIVVQVPVDTSGNQVTVVGQGNTVTSTGGSTTGGGTSGGTTPVTTPPGGVVVSPPTTGGGGTANQGSGQPGATALPSTGAGADLLALALLGMLLLSAGLVLGRPRRLTVR